MLLALRLSVVTLLALAVQSVTATSIKKILEYTAEFQPHATALPAEDRARLAAFVASLRSEDWCPTVLVIAVADTPRPVHQGKVLGASALTAARTEYVANLLRMNGVPPTLLFSDPKLVVAARPGMSASVGIEAIGEPPYPECSYPRGQHGFRLSTPDA